MQHKLRAFVCNVIIQLVESELAWELGCHTHLSCVSDSFLDSLNIFMKVVVSYVRAQR